MSSSLAKNTVFQSFVQEFLGSYISIQTKRAYLRDLANFFDFVCVEDHSLTHPKNLRPQHFIDYRDHLMDGGLQPATIHRRMVSVRSFMKWCHQLKLIDSNPLEVVKLPRLSTTSPTIALTDEEAIEIINAPDPTTKQGALHRLIFVLLFNLGLRRSELTHIRLKDIYDERHHTVLKVLGKGEKIRLIPLNAGVLGEINDYLISMDSHGIKFDEDDFLCFSSYHKKDRRRPMDGSSIYRILQRYTQKLGINKKIGPHSCRSTVISHLLDTCHAPIRDVADFAGHSNISTTQRYDKKRKGLDESAAYLVKFEKSKD